MSTEKEILRALDDWFDAGHSRFGLILQGARSGSVLMAHNRRPEPPEIVQRVVLSAHDGVILERVETPLPLAELAADPVNAPALVEASRARLAGAVAPPPVAERRAPAPRA